MVLTEFCRPSMHFCTSVFLHFCIFCISVLLCFCVLYFVLYIVYDHQTGFVSTGLQGSVLHSARSSCYQTKPLGGGEQNFNEITDKCSVCASQQDEGGGA